MLTPSIKQIETIIKSLEQLLELKRPGQFGNRSIEKGMLLSIETFWPDVAKTLPRGENWLSEAMRFIEEVEDPKGGLTWPENIQSLIDDILEKTAPLQEFIDKHGPESLKDRTEIELRLFAAHPEKLTWLIREFKNLRGIITNRQQKSDSGNSQSEQPPKIELPISEQVGKPTQPAKKTFVEIMQDYYHYFQKAFSRPDSQMRLIRIVSDDVPGKHECYPGAEPDTVAFFELGGGYYAVSESREIMYLYNSIATSIGTYLIPTLCISPEIRDLSGAAIWSILLYKEFESSRFTIKGYDILTDPLLKSQQYIAQLIVDENERLGKKQQELQQQTPMQPVTGTEADKSYQQTEKQEQYRIGKKGSFWEFTYKGQITPPLEDLFGMKYIAYLLRHPNKDISAIELERKCHFPDPVAIKKNDRVFVEAGPESDLGNLTEYNPKKINDAKQKLQADYDNETDPAQQAEIKEQINMIENYMRNSTDIHGKPRTTGDPLEKARKRVCSAIETALEKIKPNHEKFWQHLDKSISKGRQIRYSADIPWAS